MINTCKRNPCCGNFRDCNYEGHYAANSGTTTAVGRQGDSAEAGDAGHLRGPVSGVGAAPSLASHGPDETMAHRGAGDAITRQQMLDALRQQRGWVMHWQSDAAAGLLPTPASLEHAMRELSAIIDPLRAAQSRPSNPVSAEVTVTDAARDVLAERRRQVEAEGWMPEHDDAHDKGELSAAAGVYALAAASHDYRWVLRGSPVNDYLAAVFKLWPFEWSWFKPKSRRQDKVKAAALLLADIEREDRAALASLKEVG